MSPDGRCWAVVPAAGRGERYGSRLPKQYERILGRPVLSWALRAVLAERSIRRVVVALAAGDRRFGRLAEASDARIRTCPGGAQRCASVANALESLAGEARDGDWVLVHDAARPCLQAADLRALIDGVGRDSVGGLLAVPVGETLKRAGSDGRVDGTVSRDGLWRAMTPQMFRYGLLKRALALCIDRERNVTDEAAAIEAMALRPRLVRGRVDNIKITHREDRGLAAAILASRATR